MEFDEHEDQEEEMEEIPPLQALPQGGHAEPMGRSGGGDGGASSARMPGWPVRYMECLRNHAVERGKTAVDGCGEFMAAGEEGTMDALRCAACGCHRNFHRKETDHSSGGGGVVYHQGHPQYHHQHQFSPYYRAAPPPAGYLHLTPPPPPHQQHRPLALPSTSRDDLEDVSNPSSSGGGGGGGGGGGARGRAGLLKKRFRTKFTQEQKDRMLVFAERLGWRIQKHDEAAVEEFCSETGVKRHVLKVWMHNNKHTLGKKP